MKTRILFALALAALVAGAPFLASQAPAPAAYVSQNATWDAICQAQGADVAPGSPLALAWGTPPYSGTTGGHPPYGYRHLHRYLELAPADRVKAVRATLAAALARHVAYVGDGAKIRSGGYDAAGRPKPWLGPELPNDLAAGPTRWVYGGQAFDYTGLDEQHAWSFLFDVAKLQGVKVPFFPGVGGSEAIDGATLARARLWSETAAIVGISRQGWYMIPHPEPDNSSDRMYARLVDWMVRAYGAGVLPPEDGEQALAFVRVASKFYGMAPGTGLSTKSIGSVPPIPSGTPYMNPAFAAWAGAALYDAAAVVGIGEAQLASNLRAGALRLGRWAAESMLPGDKLPWAVSFGPAVVAGVDGKPVASLAPYFADGRAVKHDAGIDAGAWAYRGIACAAALGDPTAAAVAPKLLAKWQGDRASWPFLVGPDWSYAAPGARAAAGE